MAKIHPRRIKKETTYVNSSLNDRSLNKKKNINFSFKYFKEDGDFSITNHEPIYYKTVIERLRDLSSSSFLELMQNHSKALRFHRIDWNDSSVSRNSFDIVGDDDLFDEAYQFSVSANSHGRIMGFMAEDQTFNVVWFDRHHNLHE